MALSVVVFSPSGSQASFFGLPRALKYQLSHIGFDTPVLPPIGHARFCLKYPDECKVHAIDFRRRNVALTAQRWNDLNEINRRVNRDMVAQVTPGNGVTEEWVIAPPPAIARITPSPSATNCSGEVGPLGRAVAVGGRGPSGEHHLILVARTRDGDVVLDNLNANIRSVASIVGSHRNPAESHVLGAGALAGDCAYGDDRRQTR
jgi:predicted transglutaminase-like cysteine proteinase